MDAHRKESLESRLKELILEGYFDRLVRRLEGQFGVDFATVEDALAETVAKLMRRWAMGDVMDAGAWITTVATNRLKAPTKPTDELSDELPWSGPSPEDQAVAAGTLRFVMDIMGQWENRNMAVITQLYVEAAFAGEPLALQEARELAEQILGESVSLGSVGKWKERGFDRLARELDELGFRD